MLNRALGLILAAIAIVLFVIAVWNSAGQATLFDPDTYKNGLERQNIYADIVPVVLPALAEETQPESDAFTITDIRDALSPEDWRAVANEIVPPAWLQEQVEDGIDVLFELLGGNAEALNQTIDISQLRQRLTGPEAARAIERILTAAPACSVQQVAQIRTFTLSTGDTLPICSPPTRMRNTMQMALTSTLAEIAQELPEQEVPISELFDLPRENEIIQVGLSLEIYRQLSALAYLCPLALLALIVAATVRTLKQFGRWVGWTSMISGIIALIPLLLIPLLIVDSIARTVVATGQPEIVQFRTSLATGLLTSALGQFSGPILVQAAIFIGVGFILLIISVVTPSASTATALSSSGVQATATGRKRRTVTIPDPGTSNKPSTG